jgi:hypothetical protein
VSLRLAGRLARRNAAMRPFGQLAVWSLVWGADPLRDAALSSVSGHGCGTADGQHTSATIAVRVRCRGSLAQQPASISAGVCGVVEDGVVPGLSGPEASESVNPGPDRPPAGTRGSTSEPRETPYSAGSLPC